MILCVDPDETAGTATTEALTAAGFETTLTTSASEAREVLADGHRPDCLVTEYDLPDGTGLDVVAAARERVPDLPAVVFTDADLSTVAPAESDVIVEFLGKDTPDAREELAALVDHSVSFLSQTAYPLPDDEDARLAALDRYSDAPETLEASLDRLTELAVALFDVSSAGVGLVDAHHERFLSCHGASFDAVDREETVCTYAILDDDLTVIEDLDDDPRFTGQAAASLGFYAGAPLVTPDGQAIGTFCVHDAEPRGFSDRERDLLWTLADETMATLETHRRLAEQHDSGDGDTDDGNAGETEARASGGTGGGTDHTSGGER
jgi:GAF domain-containing protein